MPLAFPSRSHGTIAFGFFNIESDMLLLQQLFFFADQFCHAVVAFHRSAAPDDASQATVTLPGWRIANRSDVGDLHGAIAGNDLSGFIGATYRRYPFPTSPEEFKQNPEGRATQPEIEAMIQPFGHPEEIPLRWDPADGLVSVAEYRFDHPAFDALIEYVERGGYPRWRDERRPDSVQEMMRALMSPTDR